jgi:hypothetical protein
MSNSPHFSPSFGAAPSDAASDAGLPDAGELQDSKDDRPSMLGRRFRATLAAGSAVGVVLALAAHYVITQTVEDSTKVNSWSWGFAVIGGFAVGGACSLFIYGTATDRSDTDELTVRGRADVSERGEWRRTIDRRRQRGRRTESADRNEPSATEGARREAAGA